MTMEQKQSLERLKQEALISAANHGLQLVEDKIEWNESGMDFLVAFAQDEEGQAWVLRKPRRSDVWERAENEYKVLQFLRDQLSVKLPDWRIASPELIAYSLLEGEPVAIVGPVGGGYDWRYDQATLSDTFFNSLAEALASLHTIDRDKVAEAGLRVKSPAQSRAEFADNIDKISHSFTIPDTLMKRWTTWLNTDSYWPEYTVLHHGDLHPPHILVDDAQLVTGLIDWTEAEVGDPGKDFMIHYALFGRSGLEDLLLRYERAGGQTWSRMADHIAEQWAAYPAVVAKFALITGQESDKEMAIGMIANWENVLASIEG